MLNIRHQLHLLGRISRHMLQLLLQINPLGVLLGSVHDRLIVIRRRNLVNPVLLVLLARIVLWIKRLVRRLVLSLMSHPCIDAI